MKPFQHWTEGAESKVKDWNLPNMWSLYYSLKSSCRNSQNLSDKISLKLVGFWRRQFLSPFDPSSFSLVSDQAGPLSQQNINQSNKTKMLSSAVASISIDLFLSGWTLWSPKWCFKNLDRTELPVCICNSNIKSLASCRCLKVFPSFCLSSTIIFCDWIAKNISDASFPPDPLFLHPSTVTGDWSEEKCSLHRLRRLKT